VHVEVSTMRCVSLLLIALSGFVAGTASAQMDFSGEWAPLYHEDVADRILGPEIGDYTALPLNDAARMRGDTF